MVLTNNFEDGSAQGWGIGNASTHPNPPANITSGGPDGVDDNFLQTQANGGAGAGSRLAFFNENPEWTGDYTAGEVTGITASANNQGGGTIVLRVALDGAGGRFVTTEGITLSPGSGWQDVAFSIEAADLTAVGGTDVAATLADVSQIRFINSSTPSYQGAPVAAQLGIDNIATVGGEPGVEPPTTPQPPSGDLPIVSYEAVPAVFSEEAENNLVEYKFTVDGELPEGGLVIKFKSFGENDFVEWSEQFAADPPPELVNLEFADFTFNEETGLLDDFDLLLTDNEASFQIFIVNDILEEGSQVFDFRIVEGEGYIVDPNQSPLFTINDDNGGPGVGPTVGLSVSETNLVEADTFTVTFDVEGDVPAEGVQVLVQSDVPGSLGQFDLANLGNITTTGIEGLPQVGDAGGGSFFITITDSTATITLDVFDDIIAEDPLDITFTLANGEEYEVDPNAASTTLTISDQVQDSGPTVSLSVDRTELIEGGDPVTLTISVEGDIPEGGLPVLINDATSAQSGVRSLTEFDVANVTTTGIDGFPSPAEGDSGFFVTVTEPTATITLAAFDEGADEDEALEQFNFAVIDGEGYEVDPAASSVTVSIADAVPELPTVTLTVTDVASEDESPTLTLTFTTEGDIPAVEFDSEGNQVGGGLPITIEGDFLNLFSPELDLLNQSIPLGIEPATGIIPIANRGAEFDLALTAPEVNVTVTLFDDIIEEEPLSLSFAISEGEGYEVGGDGPATVTIVDGDSVTPGSGPTVSLSVSDTDLDEGDELTVNFDVEGEIPDDGLQVFIDGGPTALGEFNIFNEDDSPAVELEGINEFPLQGGDSGGFFVTLNDNQASLTLSVFEDGPGEGEEVLNFELTNGEQYEVDPNASTVDLTINNDTPEGTAIVGLAIEPAFVSENAEDTSTVLTFNVTNAEIPTPEFDAEGNLVSGGLSVFFDGTDAGPLFEEIIGGPVLDGLVIGGFSDPDQPNLFEIVLLQETSSVTLEIIDDVIEEESQAYSFSLLNDDAGVLGSNYVVSSDASTATVTLNDGSGGPGVGPTVGITATETDLVEGGSVTLNFAVDGEIPADGLEVLVQSPTPGAIGEFSIFDENGNFLIETTGLAGFPESADGVGSSFLATITEPNASITLSVFDDGPNEGLETLTFDLVNGEEYEVASDASSVEISIDDGGTSSEPPTEPPAEPPTDDAPVVGISIEPAVVTEEDADAAFSITLTVDGEIPTPVFDADGNLVSGGLSVLLGPTDISVFNQFGGSNNFENFVFGPNNFFGAIPDSFASELILLENTATLTQGIFNDILEEETVEYSFQLVEAGDFIDSNYIIAPDAGTASFTFEDGIGGPGVGPTVSLSVSDNDLFEGDELTVNFDVDGEIPEDGLQVFVGAGGPADVGEFVIFNEDGSPAVELEGINEFPLQGGADGGFFVTLNENQASLTLSVFEDGPGEGEEVLNFALGNGELYEVAPDAGSVDLTINDTPPGTPIISITADTTEVSEEDGTTQTVTFSVTNGEIPTPVFDDEGNLVSGGLSFLIDGSALATLGEELVGGNPTIGEGIAFGSFFDPERPLLFNFVLLENNATSTATFLNDIIEEPTEEYTFTLLPSDAGPINSDYVVSSDAATVSLRLTDGNGGPGVGPTVGITATETDLVEGGSVTLNFAVDGEIPADGLEVLVQSPTPGAIGEFSIFDENGNFLIETTGLAGFPESADGVGSSFLATITEPNASITLSVFDDGPGEGLETLTFEVVNGEEYEVAPDASSITVNIDDAAATEPELPVINFFFEPAVVAEDSNQEPFRFTITVDGEIPEDGLLFRGNEGFIQFFTSGVLEVDQTLPFSVLPDVGAFGPVDFMPGNTEVTFRLTGAPYIIEASIFDDIIEDEDVTIDFEILPGDGYLVGPNSGATVTFTDGDSVIPGSGPTVSLSVSDTELEEGDELTVNFDVDGEIPEDGLQVFVDSGPTDLGEFNIFNEDGSPAIELEGIDEFPLQGDDTGGFFVTLVENQASIGLSVFEDGANEGLETLTFDLANGEQYEVGDGTVTLTINDFEIVGTDEIETLVGDDADNTIDGEAGDDIIAGGAGNDIILGGDGDDVLRGAENSRNPQDGTDGGNDIIFGGGGNDRIGGKSGNDILSGDAGDDTIYGDDGDDILMGVTGNDILVGDNFSDGSGSDLFVFGSGDGTDTVLDFEVGIDRIGIVEEEFTFADLTLTQDGANTVLGVSGETLAILNNVQAFALGESDFVTVPDVSNLDDALALI
ncbi:MAG: calcium-binding protein [Cyanobacteria bacterium P01_B01_bin.77]